MRCVSSTNTTPEKKVRSLLHRSGYRFSLHKNFLPGTPDIVLMRHKTVVFVHGCFWHRHKNCARATTPSSRKDYWLPKFERTMKRDQKNISKLRRMGWKVIVIWECELKKPDRVLLKLQKKINK